MTRTINLFLQKIKFIVKLTALYGAKFDNYFKPPDLILSFVRKKTRFRAVSNEYGPRFLLYLLYYTLIALSVLSFALKQNINRSVGIFMTGGVGVYISDSLLFLIFRVAKILIFTPSSELKPKFKTTKLKTFLITLTFLPFFWLISLCIYLMFYLPIFFATVLLFGKVLLLFFSQFTPLIFLLVLFSSSTVFASSVMSLLQYWAYKRAPNEKKEE